MLLPLSRSRLIAAGGLFVLLLAGCGGVKTVPVTGKLVFPPKTKIADTDSIALTFIAEEGGHNTSASVSAKDSTFTANVLPGKYKIAVSVKAYAGMKDSESRTKEFDRQFGAHGIGATSLRTDITGDSNQSITIDLQKGSISKP